MLRVRVELGQVVYTQGVNGLVNEGERFRMFVNESVLRHQLGDWGDLGPEDKAANERALIEGTRLLSAYTAKGLPKIWILTEADRSSTCILFPSEY